MDKEDKNRGRPDIDSSSDEENEVKKFNASDWIPDIQMKEGDDLLRVVGLIHHKLGNRLLHDDEVKNVYKKMKNQFISLEDRLYKDWMDAIRETFDQYKTTPELNDKDCIACFNYLFHDDWPQPSNINLNSRSRDDVTQSLKRNLDARNARRSLNKENIFTVRIDGDRKERTAAMLAFTRLLKRASKNFLKSQILSYGIRKDDQSDTISLSFEPNDVFSAAEKQATVHTKSKKISFMDPGLSDYDKLSTPLKSKHKEAFIERMIQFVTGKEPTTKLSPDDIPGEKEAVKLASLLFITETARNPGNIFSVAMFLEQAKRSDIRSFADFPMSEKGAQDAMRLIYKDHGQFVGEGSNMDFCQNVSEGTKVPKTGDNVGEVKDMILLKEGTLLEQYTGNIKLQEQISRTKESFENVKAVEKFLKSNLITYTVSHIEPVLDLMSKAGDTEKIKTAMEQVRDVDKNKPIFSLPLPSLHSALQEYQSNSAQAIGSLEAQARKDLENTVPYVLKELVDVYQKSYSIEISQKLSQELGISSSLMNERGNLKRKADASPERQTNAHQNNSALQGLPKEAMQNLQNLSQDLQEQNVAMTQSPPPTTHITNLNSQTKNPNSPTLP